VEEDDEDTILDDTDDETEDVAEELTLSMGNPTKVEDEELELMMVLDTVLDEVVTLDEILDEILDEMLDEVTDAPPGAAMPPGSDCDDETEVLLCVGVAPTELIGVGRLMSRVTVTRIVTVWVAVSVITRYLVTRLSR
jgi:hypothetical protein